MASKTLTNQFLSRYSSSSSLVTAITKTLQTVKPNFPFIRKNGPLNIPNLSQFSPYLNPNLVVQVINNQSNPYHALVFFDWASRPNPNPTKYSHNFHCYVAMVDLLLSHRLFSGATQFLESHKMLCDFMIAKMIRAFGVESNLRGAIDWFYRAKMVEKDGNCIKSFNNLLGVLVKANRVKMAAAIFDQVIAEGVIKVDVITYTTMIRGYCKIGRIEDAHKVFDEMPCRPNNVAFGTMLSGFCKKGMMVEARQIVDKMLMSQDCLPNVVSYTTLIDGYCKKGEMEAAMSCLDEMVKLDIAPNLITYNAIVNGFCLLGKVDEAKKMMTKMRLDGVKDDVVTHTSLLKGFCVAGRIDEAVKHLKDMSSLGVKPDVVAYGALVNEYCKLGKANDGIALLREMVARGTCPSVSSFNAVLQVLVNRGELNEAVLFLKWMPEIGLVPNFLSYYTVISSLSKTGSSVQLVGELVDCMLRDGHQLDHKTYSCLITMYCKTGELEKAAQILSDAMRDGNVINLDTFAVFVEGYFLKGNSSEAEQVALELIKRSPANVTDDYQTVLNELKCKYLDAPSL
ncbi:pentatricopeptide repeat-containing protein At5g39710-like [Chenopodium quinoa]|uniref:Pentatricopeptide repeat-containing protein n=1 Tax=Chenopodium quinoa TaxID=63459 RepID=A0A803LB59_CHEQI|nr:pentatricopeptide repeat-containing protein At5g39710-like [Chenopodium quinoa]